MDQQNEAWLKNITQPESEAFVEILRWILKPTPRWLHPLYYKVLPHAVEVRGYLLVPEIQESLLQTGNYNHAGMVANAAGLTQQPELTPALIEAVSRWEAEKITPYSSLRSLGFIGGDIAREFLLAASQRYLVSRDAMSLAVTAQALAYLGHPDCVTALETLARESDTTLPSSKFSLKVKVASGLGLARLDHSWGRGIIEQALKGELGEEAQWMTLRLLQTVAPDARMFIPELCKLLLASSSRFISFVRETLEIMTGCEPLYEPLPHGGMGYDTTQSVQMARMTLQSAIQRDTKERIRAALFLGLLGVEEVRDDLIQEAREDTHQLSRQSLHTLAHGPLANDPLVQQLFSRAIDRRQEDDARFLDPAKVEAIAVQAKAGDTTAQNSCVHFLEHVADWHGALLRLWIGEPVTDIRTLQVRSVLTLIPTRNLVLSVLDPAIIKSHSRLIWSLYLTSRRDVRLRCVQALMKSGSAEERAWLLRQRSYEPSSLVRAAITEG